nr:PAS domain S-box protein [Calditrichia bacterium]
MPNILKNVLLVTQNADSEEAIREVLKGKLAGNVRLRVLPKLPYEGFTGGFHAAIFFAEEYRESLDQVCTTLTGAVEDGPLVAICNPETAREVRSWASLGMISDYILESDLPRLDLFLEREWHLAREREECLKARQGLSRDAQRFRALLEAAAEAIVITDTDGIIVRVNSRAEKLYGYDRMEMQGQSVEMLLPEELRDKHALQREDFQVNPEARLMGGGRDLMARRKDGHTFPVEISLNKVRVGNIDFIMTFANDISRRKQMEKALLRSERRYRQLFEETLSGNFVLGADWVIDICNSAFSEMFAFETVPDAIGKDFGEFFMSPEDAQRFKEELQASGQIKGREIKLRRRDGKEIFGVLTMTYSRDRENDIVRIGGVMFDDTRRREMEQQLIQGLKMESLGLLAGGIAHDFNNMISVINACSAMLQKQVEAEGPIRKNVEMIARTAKQAGILTNQILTFSRQQEIQPEPLILNTVVAQTGDMLNHLLGSRITLGMDLEPDLPPVEVDPNQLEQVLVNLAVNARDAMAGGGKLFITTVSRELTELEQRKFPELKAGKYV